MNANQLAFRDLMDGRRRKEKALRYAEARAKEWLEQARRFARWHCHKYGSVTADDVVAAVPFPRDLNPNLRGALFRTKGFRRRGFTLSKRPEAHCNLLGVWELCE